MSTKLKVAILVLLVAGVIGLIVWDSYFRKSQSNGNQTPATASESATGTGDTGISGADAPIKDRISFGDNDSEDTSSGQTSSEEPEIDPEQKEKEEQDQFAEEQLAEKLKKDTADFFHPRKKSNENNDDLNEPSYIPPSERDKRKEKEQEKKKEEVNKEKKTTEEAEVADTTDRNKEAGQEDNNQPRGNWPKTYDVRKNDNYWNIARKFYGSGKKWEKINRANPKIDPTDLKEGMKIKIPAPEGAAAVAQQNNGDSGTSSPEKHEYVVKKGDNYWKICKKIYGKGFLAKKLRNINGISPSRLKPGMIIKTPPLGELTGEDSSDDDQESNNANNPPREAESGEKWYQVKKGERLWDISEKFYGTGTRWKEIYRDNKDRIENPKNLKEGTWVLIKTSEE